MKKNNKILFIAAEFPPSNSIGRIRILKFCLHLSNLGWEPYVLTVKNIGTGIADNTDEIPAAVKVFRANYVRPTDLLIETLKKVFIKNKQTKPENNAIVKSSVSQVKVKSRINLSVSSILNFVKKIKLGFDKFLYKNLLIPDDFISWLVPAYRVGKKICKEHEIDVIFSTAPPFTSLLLGYYLKKATHIPWIADYRDLWTGDVLREWVPAWRRKIESGIEQKILTRADRIITVSEPKSSYIKGKIDKIHTRHVITLTNGYDTEEYPENIFQETKGRNKLRFIYTGRLFKNRRGYEFIEAIGELVKSDPGMLGFIQVEYYGNISTEIQERIHALLDKYNIGQNFKFHDEITFEESKKIQANADILLLIVDFGETTEGVIPGKLFEYIAAKKPILCIANDGATKEIIQQGKLGWVFKHGDIDSIIKFLSNFIPAYLTESYKYEPDLSYLRQYDRKNIASRLDGVIQELL